VDLVYFLPGVKYKISALPLCYALMPTAIWRSLTKTSGARTSSPPPPPPPPPPPLFFFFVYNEVKIT